MHKVLLVNKDLRGQQIQPVSGKSGKLYGNATYDPVYSCPVFSMSLEEYEKSADDVMGNPFAGQQWIPVFKLERPDGVMVRLEAHNRMREELEERLRNAPHSPQFDHLGTHFELTDYGLMIGETKITIEAINAFSGQVDPKVWFRLLKRGSDGVVTVESKVEDDEHDETVDSEQPIRRLLAMFSVNELRALAKKVQADTHGTRDDLISTISGKVSTE